MPVADGDRVDEEVQFVDQAGVEELPDDRDRPADGDVAAGLGLERGDGFDEVALQLLGVPPAELERLVGHDDLALCRRSGRRAGRRRRRRPREPARWRRRCRSSCDRAAGCRASGDPTTAPISSLKYGKCHFSGASTTPSTVVNRLAMILLMVVLRGIGAAGSAASCTAVFKLALVTRTRLYDNGHVSVERLSALVASSTTWPPVSGRRPVGPEQRCGDDPCSFVRVQPTGFDLVGSGVERGVEHRDEPLGGEVRAERARAPEHRRGSCGPGPRARRRAPRARPAGEAPSRRRPPGFPNGSSPSTRHPPAGPAHRPASPVRSTFDSTSLASSSTRSGDDLDQLRPGLEVSVDRDAAQTRLAGDVAHAGVGIRGEAALGRIEDRLDVPSSIGATRRRLRHGSYQA